jgi:hypothetical protein
MEGELIMRINNVEVIDDKCEVPLIVFDKPTINKEIFSKRIVEKCILRDDFIKIRLDNNMLFGELLDINSNINNNPSRFIKIDNENICIQIDKLYITDLALMGNIKLIEPLGKKLDKDGYYRTAYRIFHKKIPKIKNVLKIINKFVPITFDLMLCKLQEEMPIFE